MLFSFLPHLGAQDMDMVTGHMGEHTLGMTKQQVVRTQAPDVFMEWTHYYTVPRWSSL